ncbi:MAG: hypothetical protein ACFB12_19150 [Leptolyngbyaceae cyanobacterium]
MRKHPGIQTKTVPDERHPLKYQLVIEAASQRTLCTYFGQEQQHEV